MPKPAETESALPYERNVLVTGESQRELEKGFYFSGVGHVEDKLHVQLYTPGRSQYDDHAFLHLRYAAGEQKEPDMLCRGGYRGIDPSKEQRANYLEYAFDAQKNEVDQWSLYSDFYHATGRVDGSCNITVPLEQEQ